MFTASEYQNELKMILSEFDIWNLNISENDGLPQKICLTCFDSFCQIHNFRIMCEEAQTNFSEMCTGLDIIIKTQSEFNGEFNCEFPEDFEGEQIITIQEHYRFPREVRTKTEVPAPTPSEISSFIVNTEQSREDEINEMNQLAPEIKPHRCEYCMDVVSFDDPDLLNDHYNALHSTDFPYLCPKCEKCFDSKFKRNVHAKCHYRILVECDICGKKVRGGKPMMAQHNELHHIEIDRECPTCGKIFPKATLKSFNYHMSWHDDAKLHKCKYCEKKFVQITHLVVHEKSHTGACVHQCCECGIDFMNDDLLKEHKKIHEQPIVEEDQKVPIACNTQQSAINTRTKFCEVCEKYFRSSFNLRMHNYKAHGGAPVPVVKQEMKLKRHNYTVPVKPFKCSKCPETFLLHTQLVMHIKKHDENKPFKCSICPKSFKKDKYLRCHIDGVHLKKKAHICTICGSAFTLIQNLSEHIALKHKGEVPREHKCEICYKEFITEKSLKNHMLRHSDVKPFECLLCNKKFRQSIVLKAHVKGHEKKQAKFVSKLTDNQKDKIDIELNI